MGEEQHDLIETLKRDYSKYSPHTTNTLAVTIFSDLHWLARINPNFKPLFDQHCVLFEKEEVDRLVMGKHTFYDAEKVSREVSLWKDSTIAQLEAVQPSSFFSRMSRYFFSA